MADDKARIRRVEGNDGGDTGPTQVDRLPPRDPPEGGPPVITRPNPKRGPGRPRKAGPRPVDRPAAKPAPRADTVAGPGPAPSGTPAPRETVKSPLASELVELHADAADLVGLDALRLPHAKANRLVRRLEPVMSAVGFEAAEAPFWWQVVVLIVTVGMIYLPMMVALRMHLATQARQLAGEQPDAPHIPQVPQVQPFQWPDAGADPAAHQAAPAQPPAAPADPAAVPPVDIPGVGRISGGLILPNE